jgi:hypothetical protein
LRHGRGPLPVVEDTLAMADDLSSAFSVLMEDTLRRCDQAAADLQELDRAYSGGVQARSYKTYISALQLVTEATRTLLEKRREAFVPQEDYDLRSSIYELVRNVAATMPNQLEGQIQLLRLPRSEELDVFAAPLTRLAKMIIGNAEVLFFPWTAFEGYRLETYDGVRASGLAPGIRDSFEREYGKDIQFLKLRHPSPRRSDLFQHAVFAHELAHAAIRQPAPEDLAQELPPPSTGQPPHTYASIAALSAPTGLAEPPDMLLDWFTELACDVVGVRLIGPAFMVAFAEVTAANRSVEGGDRFRRHPSPTVRFNVLNEEITRFALPVQGEALRAVLNEYGRSHEGTHPQPTPSAPAREWLEDALARFRGPSLSRLLARAEYVPHVLAEDLPHVLRLVDAGIPPAERITAFDDDPREQEATEAWSRELDWRSILNGVLLRFLRVHGPPSADANPDRVEARRKAARVALGAIELSEFQRQARALRNQARDFALPEGWAP